MAKRYLKITKGGTKQRIVQDDVSPFFISGLEKNGFKLDPNYKEEEESEKKVAEVAKKLNDKIDQTLKKKAEVKKPVKASGEAKAIVKKPIEEVVDTEETTKTEGENSTDTSEEVKEEEKPKEEIEGSETESIEDLKNEYIKLYDRPVAIRFSKNADWLKEKIKAKKAEKTN